MDPDDRTFMRELLLRHKKATDAMIARFEENTRRFAEHHDQTMREHDQMLRDHAEFMDEQRAQRKAMWRVFDLLYGELDA